MMTRNTGSTEDTTFPTERELIVVAKPDVGLRATRAGVTSTTGADVSSLASLLAAANASMEPLFDRAGARDAAAAPADGDEATLELAKFYKVSAADDRMDDLAASLRDLDLVEAAYVKPGAEPPIAPVAELDAEAMVAAELPATPDFTALQGYLDTAPGGIDARYAWTRAGGRGAGIGIVDIEGAWNFAHEDLIQNQGGVIAGTETSDASWRNHGTAVVGEFGGDSNSFGITGICPDAHVRAASIFGGTGTAGAIVAAADASSAGDIILIELHRPGPRFNFQPRLDQRGYIAIYWWPDDFAAVQYATSKDVIIVAAAGNGAENLDDGIYDVRPTAFPVSWKNPFNPANPHCGAITAGAGAPPPGTNGRDHGPDRSRLEFSNYGARVDAQGWGREVATAGYGDLQNNSGENEDYTLTFSGTSSASPIVVGALACVQGVLRAQGTPVLSPAQARSYLRTTGSPQQDAPGRPASQRVGNRPNLRELIPLVAKTWYANQTVTMTFASSGGQNCWAYFVGLGWRKIMPGDADGVTNMHHVFCEAVANGQKVTIYADGTYVHRVYLS